MKPNWKRRGIVAALAGGLAIAAAGARAQAPPPQPLIIGGVYVLQLRRPDVLNGQEWSLKNRLNHVQDIFARHLGRPDARFTRKQWGRRVHLYLNGDFVLAVTPADAAATGYRSAERLAPVWQGLLEKAFERSYARPVPLRPQ